MKFLLSALALSTLALAGNEDWGSTTTYNNGQWTPSATTTPYYWTTTSAYYPPWTPTTTPTSYWYGYTSYTYSTSTYCYTEGTVIVTITSLIPCPVYVTETSVVYECEECTTTPTYCEVCQDGTTTDSILTGVEHSTQGAAFPISTYTSNGYVVVVTGTANPTQAQTQVQVIYANSAERGPKSSTAGFRISGIVVMALLVGILRL